MENDNNEIEDIDYLKELNKLCGFNSGENIIHNGRDINTINNIDNTEDYDNKCLISLDQLEEDCITLECKHKFNYISLFKYLQQQVNGNGKPVITTGIVCPYCTHKTFNTLPMRMIKNKLWYDSRITNPVNKCITKEYKCKYDDNCVSECVFSICVKHHKYINPLLSEISSEKINSFQSNLTSELCYRLNVEPIILCDNIITSIANDIILYMLNVPQLKKICKSHNIKGYSKLKKTEMLELIKSKETGNI
jgi:hypothetical protein